MVLAQALWAQAVMSCRARCSLGGALAVVLAEALRAHILHVQTKAGEERWLWCLLRRSGLKRSCPACAGHSLGGALAVVFAQALHAEGHKELSGRVAGMWTYGAPRIGDSSFCQHLASTYPQRCAVGDLSQPGHWRDGTCMHSKVQADCLACVDDAPPVAGLLPWRAWPGSRWEALSNATTACKGR